MRIGILAAIVALALPVACDRGGEQPRAEEGEAQVDSDLGSLRVVNRVNEPVAVYLEGQELYAVPAGQAYTFRNLPTREVDVYAVGRISQRHYGLPKLRIEEGGEYEWTIEP